MKTRFFLFLSLSLWISCSEDKVLPEEEEIEVTAENFSATINNNPASGDVIGTLTASTNTGSLIYSLTDESISGAFALDETTGELTVGDASAFDYTITEFVTGTALVANGEISQSVTINVNVAGIVAEGFSKTIEEHPDTDELLGTVVANTNAGDFVFSITAEEPEGAFSVDASTGAVTVKDKLLFDFESTEEVTATIMASAGNVSTEVDVVITLTDVANSWQTVGEANFSAGKAHNISMAINDGIPYVAYRDEENGNKTTVMKYENETWELVGAAGFSDGYATYQSITFNNGIPYVAYRDDVNGRKTTVMKFENDSWQLVGAAGFAVASSNSYTSEYQSLVFDNDVPYLAYKDWSRDAKLTVMKFDGSDWVGVGTAGFSAGAASYVKLKFYNGTPYVAYQDDGNESGVTVAKFENDSWSVVGSAGFSEGSASYVSLCFDGSVPYVAYSDEANTSGLTVMKYESNAWSLVGSAGLTLSSAQYQSIDIVDGDIYVAFRDSFNGGKTTVMMHDGKWDVVGDAGFSLGNVNFVDMKMNGDVPYVVYRDDFGGVNGVTMMRYDDK